jgi:hypothetical protein
VDGDAKGYFYRAKTDSKEAENKKQKNGKNTMANLLQGLKADNSRQYNKFIGLNSDEEDDDDVNEAVVRRLSMNQNNFVGMNFQNYMDTKPEPGVRREILNLFNEYKESESKQHAKEEMQSICKQYSIKRFQFVGYFLNYSLAEKPDDFRRYLDLVFDFFLKDEKLLSQKDMKESINVCVAHLPDLIIDYPNARPYANEMLDRAVGEEIMNKQEAEKYRQHIAKLGDEFEVEE